MVGPQNVSDRGNQTATGDVAHSPRGIMHEESSGSSPGAYWVVRAQGHVYWGTIFAGALLAVSLLILASSFAWVCGVPAYSGGTYGFGSGLWSVISASVAFFCGGCLAAYLADIKLPRLAMLHGMMIWALTVPLILVLPNGVFGGSLANSLIGADLARMMLHDPAFNGSTGAAWGAFVTLGTGLLFAAMGGIFGSFGERLTHLLSSLKHA